MKITDIVINLTQGAETKDAQQFVGKPSRTIVKIETDEGIFGIAEGPRNYYLFKAYLDEMIKPLLVGLDQEILK